MLLRYMSQTNDLYYIFYFTTNSQTSATASLSHNASSSTSNHQHTHHHTHTHHDRLSPGNQLLRHGMHNKPSTPQANPHHLMIQPPNMGHHPATLGKFIPLKCLIFFCISSIPLELVLLVVIQC